MRRSVQATVFLFAAIAAGASQQASAANASQMASKCNKYAARHLHVSPSDIANVKYQGQRTDGTHAVNGTAFLRGGSDTFQCSFDAGGSTIVQFIVN